MNVINTRLVFMLQNGSVTWKNRGLIIIYIADYQIWYWLFFDRYFNKDRDEAVAKAYETLGLSQKHRTKDRNVILKRYKELTQIYHPDKGGNVEKMRDINVARDIILESLY